MAHSLLLELFSEEIPARMQRQAASDLLVALERSILQRFGTGQAYCTPRRIAVHINDIPTQVIAKTEEVRGPRIDAPEAALLGFMRKYNISDKLALDVREGFYYYQTSELKTDIATALKDIVEECLKTITWPKSMRWGAHSTRWVRPLHHIVCLLDNKVLPVCYGHLVASDTTQGHRFLSPADLKIASPDTYVTQLEQAHVICDPVVRKQRILNGIDSLITPLGLHLWQDEALLDEVVGLVEYPVVLLGEIPQHFMALPPEVLVTTLRNNQKYLLLRKQDETLAPYFIIVANTIAIDGGKQIIIGNQKVLNARLSDAQFFYEQDRRQKLFSRVETLNNLLFHADIGSVYTKSQSVLSLARNIAKVVGGDIALVEKAAMLAKADLVTSMVGEFPELQGVMGYYYAIADGEPEEVAYAIMEHYKPVGPSDYIPTRSTSVILALADKLDTLQQMFAIGIKPTGSKDPYALRRAAIGVIRILLHNSLSLPLAQFIEREDVLNFIAERFKVICKEVGIVGESINTMLIDSQYDIYATYQSLQSNNVL